jgi:hypothetical protein
LRGPAQVSWKKLLGEPRLPRILVNSRSLFGYRETMDRCIRILFGGLKRGEVDGAIIG